MSRVEKELRRELGTMPFDKVFITETETKNFAALQVMKCVTEIQKNLPIGGTNTKI